MNANSPLYPIVQYVESLEANIGKLTDVNTGLIAQLTSATDQITQLTAAATQLERIIDACNNYMSEKIPYVFGYEGMTGMDCSGMMRAAFGSVGIKLPRESKDQAVFYPAVAIGQEQRGDIIGIDTNGDGTINHIGLCLGNGQMIHTASPKEGINVCNYKTRYPHIIAICRPNYA